MIAGEVYGDLTLISVASVGTKGREHWNCLCACGSEAVRYGPKLKAGHTTTCGAHKSSAARAASSARAAQYPRDTNTRSRLFKIFDGMRGRCTDPKNASYKYYGAVGITVDPVWATYGAFHDWAIASGYSEGLTLDRVKNELGYSPSNCRWATQKEQCRNKKKACKMVTIMGDTKLVADWGKDPRCVVKYLTFRQRLTLGWSPERALLTPTMRVKQ